MTKTNGIDTTQLFKGRVLIAYLINPPEAFSGGVAISNPALEEFYGRIFLMG